MEAQSIKNIELTITDFELLLKGLGSIAKSEASTEVLGDLFKSMMFMDKPEVLKEIEREEAIKKAKVKREREIMNENIQLLQGKMIRLKRILIENNLMESLK